MLIHRQNHHSSENLDEEARDRMTGTNNTSPKTDGHGDILSASSSPGERGIFNRTLTRATHLPHESLGGGAPPLFPPLPLPLPRLPCPRLEEVGGLASTDARAPDTASVEGAFWDARGGACLVSRWRIVGVDKTPGCEAAAGPPRARAPSSLLLPRPSLFGPEEASFADSPSFSFPFSFSFSACALSPVAAFRDASSTWGRLELPRRESKQRPRTSSRTVRARGRRCGRNRDTRVCEVT